ncbi:MAG: DUF4255 domain-containing protein [Frankiaceae bacterium]|nr:DUF4255 domain-containing protein [Frankiaceae bacterium]MBV9369019.1 DUF4255 domain-containing protein [Frankiales bacterium]
MIEQVDSALESFLRREAALPAHEVEISFDPPDKTFAAAVNRPTLNAFLWDVRRNGSYTSTGLVQRRDGDGKLERRGSAPYVDLRYFVSAWAADRRDEHRLLGQVLQCLLVHSALPVADMPAAMSENATIDLRLATRDTRKPDSFWGAIDGKLKTGIEIELTLPVDVFAWVPTAPEVTEITGNVSRKPAPEPAPDPREGQVTRRRNSGSVVAEGRR